MRKFIGLIRRVWQARRHPADDLTRGAAVGLGLLVLAGTAAAQLTINWNNPAGGLWGDAVNWDPQNVPNAAGEEAVFPIGGGSFSCVLNSNVTLDRVRVENPAATLDLGNRTIGCLTADGIRTAGTLLVSGSGSQLTCFLDILSGGLLRIPENGSSYFIFDSLRNESKMK